MQKNLEYGFDFGCCIKLSIKSHFLKKLKKVHLIIFKVCMYALLTRCVWVKVWIFCENWIFENYIRWSVGILFSWFGSILTFQHATSDHLTWTEICIKIKRKSNKYNSWNSFENIKSISENVNILTENCILKSIIIVIR